MKGQAQKEYLVHCLRIELHAILTEGLLQLGLVHNNDNGAASVTSVVSVTEKSLFFFTSQIASLTLNFSTI